jgi:hypothetical protein
MNTKKMNEFGQLEIKIAAIEISVSILEAREYQGVKYWCSPNSLCELPLDCGTACGSEELLRDMIDADTEVP